jgi:hypothetical protein
MSNFSHSRFSTSDSDATIQSDSGALDGILSELGPQPLDGEVVADFQKREHEGYLNEHAVAAQWHRRVSSALTLIPRAMEDRRVLQVISNHLEHAWDGILPDRVTSKEIETARAAFTTLLGPTSVPYGSIPSAVSESRLTLGLASHWLQALTKRAVEVRRPANIESLYHLSHRVLALTACLTGDAHFFEVTTLNLEQPGNHGFLSLAEDIAAHSERYQGKKPDDESLSELDLRIVTMRQRVIGSLIKVICDAESREAQEKALKGMQLFGPDSISGYEYLLTCEKLPQPICREVFSSLVIAQNPDALELKKTF